MKEGIVIDGEVYKIEGIHFVRDALKNTARDRKQKIDENNHSSPFF